MEDKKKKDVHVTRLLLNYKCKFCGQIVHVGLAKPYVLETDKSVIYAWDYGHRHRVIIDFHEEKPVFFEDTSEV